jgi:hypothetical protein
MDFILISKHYPVLILILGNLFKSKSFILDSSSNSLIEINFLVLRFLTVYYKMSFSSLMLEDQFLNRIKMKLILHYIECFIKRLMLVALLNIQTSETKKVNHHLIEMEELILTLYVLFYDYWLHQTLEDVLVIF